MDRLRHLAARLRARVHLAKLQRAAPRQIAAYLAAHPSVKITLGSGSSRRPGWLATDLKPQAADIVYLDVRRPLPFRSASVRYFVAEHLIEHLTLDHGLALLRECERCLVPGGTIRLATPDVLRFRPLLDDTMPQEAADYVAWVNGIFGTALEREMPSPGLIAVNRLFRNWGHKFLYDPPTLAALTAKAGLVRQRFVAVGESDDEQLRGAETRDANPVWAAGNRYETMVLEAQKRA